MQRVTQAEVARRAGVSVATVSRALTNHPRIPAGTRQRVRALAAEMGYRPDPALAALVSHRLGRRGPGAGGNLVFLTDFHGPLNAYFQGIFDGARAQGEGMGYRLERVDFHQYPHPASVGRVLEKRGVTGLLVCPIQESRVSEEFPWERFSNVGFLLPLYRPRIHLVRDDSFRTVYEAFLIAARRGYRRPGLVIYTDRRSANTVRQIGGQRAAEETCRDRIAGLETLLLGNNAEDGPRVRAWMRAQRPDCVICTNTTVYWPLRDQGWRMPEDLGFICLWLEESDPGFSGFDPRTRPIGEALINLLDGLLKRNERGLVEQPMVSLVKRVWVEGRTLPWRVPEGDAAGEPFQEYLLP